MRTNRIVPALCSLLLAAACRTAPDRVALEAQGALGPYSSAVLAGDLCFLSGKIGTPGGAFADEAHRCIDAVEAGLQEAGLTLADVVQATVYLADMQLYGELNEVYGARFPEPWPARACIAVRELPKGARVEIVVVARRRQ